jgi:glycosyltransferase involved in cell wall biosynthesis
MEPSADLSAAEKPDRPVILSVVIPCYNQGEYLLEAIHSVEACGDKVYEIVIVNDGSTDALTVKLMQYLEDQGYFILNQDNQGLARARNNGIEKAQGRYILALDADNKIRPDYITKGIELLDRHVDVGVVYGRPEWFGDAQRSWPIPDQFEPDRLILGNFIDACTVFRKAMWQQCGGYDANMPLMGLEDWDLWLSALEGGWKFHYVPEVLFDYRVRAGSMATVNSRPENWGRLMEYICVKHSRLYATRFPKMIREREEKIGELWAQINHLNVQNVELVTRNQELETHSSDFLGQVQAAEAQRSSLLEQIHESETHHSSLLGQMQSLEQQLSGLLEKVPQLERQAAEQVASNAQLQATLEHTQAALAAAQAEIAAMESSKFWKLRKLWMRLR